MTVPLEGGARKDITLGRYRSAKSKTEYRRICAVLDGNGGYYPGIDQDVSICELILTFIRHVDGYYRRADGTRTNETVEYRQSLRPLRELYGLTLAADFGPRALKAVRENMVQAGLCRSLINQRIGRVKRMFKWAVSEELVPPTVFHGLVTVTGLQRGRSDARETEPVKPVELDAVTATLPHLSRQLAGLVRFQLLTGCRPGEACRLRRADIDTSGPIWFYRPPHHKLSYRGRDRIIAIGPKTQELLATFTLASDDAYVFSPSQAVAEFHAARSLARVTKCYPSHMKRNAAKRTKNQKRPPAECYTTESYGSAIADTIKKANERRKSLAAGEEFEPVPHWHPNQLRHTHGTTVRKRFGLEAAQVALGHARADVTQIYAEKNQELAATVAAAIG
ncbi:tyrosine-type recombinase/integrase [soil metagenome]